MRFVTVLALLALATPALAQEAAVTADQAAKPEKPKKDKKDPNRQVCRSVGGTASRLGGRPECHTQAEWDEIARGNQRSLNGRN